MNSNLTFATLLRRLWCHISPRRRGQFGLLLLLMILVSFAEILSIGAVLPFLAALTNPQHIFDSPLAQPVIHFLGITIPNQLLLLITVAFVLASLVAGALRLLLLWAITRLSFAAGADFSNSLYRRTLYQPYAVHVARNSSEIISGISNKISAVIFTITALLTLLGSSVILFAILIALLSIDPLVAFSTFGGFGLIYIIIIRLTQKRQLAQGHLIAQESTQVIKLLQEGLGGIRDILIDGTQATFCHIYRNADMSLRRAQGDSQFIAQSPRYGVEAFGMALIAILAYALAQQSDGIVKAIPILGALALGAQRLLPVLQQAFQSWSGMQSQKASLQDALDLLDQPLPDILNEVNAEPLQFLQKISLHHLCFRYDLNKPWVLRNIDLEIIKGSRVGFIGITGSGKSTLLDIIMGLLPATEGELKIDGKLTTIFNRRSWQAHIAHVPQSIFLADGTIEENIAFGVPKKQIDFDKVKLAAESAQIAHVIEGWEEQYQTEVGERGVRLSGGQRQRIGIARALYKEADVIILDEATSALDNETEQAVMQAIDGLGKEITLIIIAHRLTTLKNCTQIIELSAGGIKRVGSYQDIVKQLHHP
jgi:ABC-type multidrug transport system fused ATPase/permease subunit